MTDFIAEFPKKQKHPINLTREQWWTLHVNKAFKVFGFGVGLVLQSPTGELIEQVICLSFFTSNNEVEYETILAGLNLTLMLVTTKLKIKSDS